MIAVQFTQRQFRYIQDAVKRDLDALEEMSPWDIDAHIDEYVDDIRCSKEVGGLLSRVEQEQVVTH